MFFEIFIVLGTGFVIVLILRVAAELITEDDDAD